MAPDPVTTQHPIILFDGVCNLCARSVQFIISRDPAKHFRFASLQSDIAAELTAPFVLPDTLSGTFVLLEKGKMYTRSTAALRVAKKLDGAWPLLYMFIIVPPFIRNAFYNWIAKNRYKWFGKKEACWLPSPELKERFLS